MMAITSLYLQLKMVSLQIQFNTFMQIEKDKFGFVPQALTALTNHHRYTHTFVCTPDIPWAPDPLRVNPFDRERLFQEYIKMLKLIGSPFTIIEGDGPASALGRYYMLGLAYSIRGFKKAEGGIHIEINDRDDHR